MKVVQVQLLEDLVAAAQMNRSNPSANAARLLALELPAMTKYRWAGAAELSETPVEAFMEFAGQRQVPLQYGASELETDRHTMQRFQK
jgi:hypothetical protein